MVWPQSFQAVPHTLWLHLQARVQPTKDFLRHAKADFDIIVDALVAVAISTDFFEDGF